MDLKIIQWNPNGYYQKYEEIKQLIDLIHPSIICLQESHLLEQQNVNIRNFTIYRKDYLEGKKAAGGVLTAVNNEIFSEKVDIITPLQAVTVKLMINPGQYIFLCNLYLPPGYLEIQDLNDLVGNLPTPFLLIGDFNAHHRMWGGEKNDRRGNLIENLITTNDQLILLNNGQPTHIHIANGSFSAIDLSLCSSGLAPKLNWDVHPDLCASDHFPIIINMRETQVKKYNYSQRWITEKVDWDRYAELTYIQASDQPITDIDQTVNTFTEHLLKTAYEIIPRTLGRSRHFPVPWWDQEVALAIKERKKALRTYRNNRTIEHFIIFKKMRAKARNLIRSKRKESWDKFISNINSNTTDTEIWNNLRKLARNKTNISIHHIYSQNEILTNPAEIAQVFTKYYSSITQEQEYKPEFIEYKQIMEQNEHFEFSDNNNMSYNSPISVEELENSLSKQSNSTPGPDDIHPFMLKHMHETSKQYLMNILQHIWTMHKFPSQWKRAIILPIHKAGKPKLNPESYRPISLTSCVCKVMENIINQRLAWHIEQRQLLTPYQYGFRKYRSTIDHLVTLENEIARAYQQKEYVITIFFDIKRAFDLTWRHKIIKQLLKFGFNGNIVYFIQNFLSNRLICTKIANQLSNYEPQYNGLPQGSILSPILFNIAINDLTEKIQYPIKYYLYADDLCTSLTIKDLSVGQKILQQMLNNLEIWSDNNGLQFSTEKTKVMIFHQQRKFNPNLKLKLFNQNLLRTNQHTFLGLTLDERLTWLPHLKKLRASCQKSLCLLKVVNGLNNGSDRKTLLKLYRSLIQSKLNYGAIIYSSAKPKVLSILDPIHHTGLRIATGVYRSCPISSLLCEANELSLNHRREEQLLRYALRIKSLREHPNKNILEAAPQSYILYTLKEHMPKPYIARLKILTTHINYKLPEVIVPKISDTPPYHRSKLKFNRELEEYPKTSTPIQLYKQIFLSVIEKYPDYKQIYTDGSKTQHNVGCAYAVSNEGHKLFKLPTSTSIFTAELMAIYQALKEVNESSRGNYFIFTDSLSSIKALQAQIVKNNLARNVVLMTQEILKKGSKIIFAWIPSHVGINENERVDEYANTARTHGTLLAKTVIEDEFKNISSIIRNIWQKNWSRKTDKLKEVKPNISEWQSCYRKSRREEIVLARLRTGHSNLTHKHLFKKEEPPICNVCNEYITIKHLLSKCPLTKDPSNNEASLAAILGDDEENIKLLINKLKEANIYQLI